MRIEKSPCKSTAENIIVIEENDYDAGEVIRKARAEGATTKDQFGEVFWIVYSVKPFEVWDFTESMVRIYFNTKVMARLF